MKKGILRNFMCRLHSSNLVQSINYAFTINISSYCINNMVSNKLEMMQALHKSTCQDSQ